MNDEKSDAICSYADNSVCQEYVSPSDGHTDTNYRMGKHFFWLVYPATIRESNLSARCPKGTEVIGMQLGYGLHHPELANNAQICRDVVNAVVSTFGDRLCGFNYIKTGQTGDYVIENGCDKGNGFSAPFWVAFE